LAIGDEYCEMNLETVSKRQCFTKHNSMLLYKGTIEKKLIFKPPETQRYYALS
jgi:hypothetical protein